jgi:hypothetical protein
MKWGRFDEFKQYFLVAGDCYGCFDVFRQSFAYRRPPLQSFSSFADVMVRGRDRVFPFFAQNKAACGQRS